MENGVTSRKKSKKKKIRSNSPQTSNGSEKVRFENFKYFFTMYENLMSI